MILRETRGNGIPWENERLGIVCLFHFYAKNLENTPAVELDKIISLIQRKNNHEAAHKLIKIIDNAASLSKTEPQKSQKITSFRHKRRKKKQKAWFDKDIQALKKKLINGPI